MALHIQRLDVKGISAKNLSVDAGEAVALTGASGMGKSLFLKAIADLILHQGDIQLDRQNRDDLPAPLWRQRVTFVGAKSAWWDEKVRDHFTDQDWLKAVLPEFDLSPKVVDWSVSRLSSGEAQRLCLLRALEGTYEDEVRYLLLDEPTSALDGGRQTMVEDVLRRYMKTGQIGIIFVSHDERQVERFADRQWQIYNRRVSEVSS